MNKLTDAIPASASLPSRRRRRILLRAGIILLILLGIGEMVSRFVLGLGDPPLYVADNEIQYYNLPARTYHRFGNGLLNGFYGRDIVEMHIANGQTYLGPAEIDCMSVAEVLRRAENAEIDLLNIDIETMEASVLSAWDWMNRRPKIICVEIHARTMINAAAISGGWLAFIIGVIVAIGLVALVGRFFGGRARGAPAGI